jgi:hypothetical protein
LGNFGGLRYEGAGMLVRGAIAICRFVPGRARMMSTGLLAVMTAGLLHLVGAKSNRTRGSTYRSVEDCHGEDGHDDSGPIGISFHKHLKPTTIFVSPCPMQRSENILARQLLLLPELDDHH